MTTLVALLCACQDGKCFYCGVQFSGPRQTKKHTHRMDQWSREHVYPLSKGGRLYVLACVGCNNRKAARLPAPEEMRRAIELRHQVDRIGRALIGSCWVTLEEEKAIVAEKIYLAHRRRVFSCPREESPQPSQIAEMLEQVL